MTLLMPTDLLDLPGAPFDERLVEIAAASLQGDAGWHIAPVITETVTVRNRRYGAMLYLPSRRVVAVTAVRDVSWTTPVTMTDWTLRGNRLYRRAGWVGILFEVDMQHGYPAVPLELLPLVADRARALADARAAGVSRYSVTVDGDSESVTYRDAFTDPVLSRYALPPGVA